MRVPYCIGLFEKGPSFRELPADLTDMGVSENGGPYNIVPEIVGSFL